MAQQRKGWFWFGDGRRNQAANADQKAGDQLARELPGFTDGYRDGLVPGIEKAFTETIAARSARERLDWTRAQEETRSVVETDLRNANARLAAHAGAQAETPAPQHPLWLCVLFAVVALLAVAGETALVSEMAEILGYVDPREQWAFGAGFTFLLGVGLEVTHRSFGRAYRFGFLTAVVVALSTLAALRLADLRMEAIDVGNPWAELLVGQPAIVYAFLLFLSLMLALGVALILDALRTSLPWHRLALLIAAERRERERHERVLALVTSQIANISERIDTVAREKLAECEAGITARRHYEAHREQAPAPWWRRITAGQVVRFALATATVVVAAFFLAGCGTNNGGHHVLVVDTSRSSPISDADATHAVRAHLARLQRGSRLDVLPVNGKAGDILTFDVPRLGRPYDRDLETLFGEADQKVLERLMVWRKTPGSDYAGVLRLAEERLRSTPADRKTLAILGDMVDANRRYFARDRRTGKSVHLGMPRGSKKLPVLALAGTHVYVGLLPGTVTVSGWAADQHRETIAREIVGWGVPPRDLTLNVFGVQGLEAWTDTAIGSVSKAFSQFAQRAARRQRAMARLPREGEQ